MLGQENPHYKLLLTLLKNHLDEPTIDAIRQTNSTGEKFAKDLQPVSLNVEGTLLLAHKAVVLEEAKNIDDLHFEKKDYDRLLRLFTHLEKLKVENKHIPATLLSEINTLTALSQLREFDKINLYYITRLTNTFCEKVLNLCKEHQLFLRSLTIRSPGLTKISPKIGTLAELEDISIEHGKIDQLPVEIGQLKNLKRLSILMTSLTGLPESICRLKNLEELNINGCLLTGLPEDIGKNTQLKSLDVSTNALKALPESLSECRGLSKLSIYHNTQITSLPSSISAKLICMDLEVFASYLADHEGQLPLGVKDDKNILFLRGNYPDFTINLGFVKGEEPLRMQINEGYPEEGYVMTNVEGDTEIPDEPQRLVFIHDERLIDALTDQIGKIKL